ncbi:hypothetical protein [Neisseria meningitidis]|uniref:hypothetical protein n=1 Tax=Neisseria meningitidis TaxID=487 RepID=UPI000FCC0F64|nr:hypothetical protein [Neisseria meningitidis]
MPVFFKTAAQKTAPATAFRRHWGAIATHGQAGSLRQTTGTIQASDGFAVYGRGTIPAAIELANIASDKPHAQKNE